MSAVDKPVITIEYCNLCRWMLRAAWLAQELLSSFDTELERVCLKPGSGGIFEIRLNWQGQTHTLWERVRDGGFPEAKILKQRLRDKVWPERDLGHSDSN